MAAKRKSSAQVIRQGTATWVPDTGYVAPATEQGSNSSREWWSITGTDGQEVSLHQWGWSVTTVGGSRYDLPPRRGSDLTLAYRPGQVHRRKLPDARPITLLMFMVGWDPATGDAPPDQLLQWNDNWDSLRRLVFRHSLLDDQRVKLTRRWLLTVPDFNDIYINTGLQPVDAGVPPQGPRLLTAFAWAEMTGTMAPTMTGRLRSEFQLDFTLADPYFYASTVTATVTSGFPTYVWNDGHDVAASGYMQVDLKGPLTNPKLINRSTDPDSWVQYNGFIAAGDTVRLTVNRFTCEKLLSSGNQNRIQYLSSFGARYWVSLLPGVNKLELQGGGSGEAVVSFRPPYV
jgi:hypothetical protein